MASLLLRLKAETSPYHSDADSPWLGLLRADVRAHEYADLLARTYGFLAPLEGACAYASGISQLVDHRQLSRAGLVAQDLLALGLTPTRVAGLPHCTSIRPLEEAAEALGWLFVIDRAALLRESVRRHLVGRFPKIAVSYLGVGAGAGDRHDIGSDELSQRFAKAVDQVGAEPVAADQILAGATAAFHCMRAWFHDLDGNHRGIRATC